MKPSEAPARTHSVRCPLFNPFKPGLLEAHERRELVGLCILLVAFLLGMGALIGWMAASLPG